MSSPTTFRWKLAGGVWVQCGGCWNGAPTEAEITHQDWCRWGRAEVVA